MKIMLVTMDYPPPLGGIQVVTKNLEEDLLAAGHEVYLLNFDGRNTNNFQRLRPSDLFYTEATRNDYYKLGNLLNPAKLFVPSGYRDFVYNNLIFRETKRVRESFRPDITHILKPSLYAAIVDSQEPFIVSCHGSDVRDTFPDLYSLEHGSAIHCVSNYMKELVGQILGDKLKAIPTVIYNSVDLSMFEDRADVKENIFVTCCRLVERKNVHSIIKAISLLSLKILEEFSFVIIGDGPEKKKLINMVRRLNLKNVKFLGELHGKKKVEWLCRSKAFILCPKSYMSSFESGYEGFGISYIEAQAAGLPLIGSNQGGIPEAVGDAGILVENPTDPEEIASCIQKLIMDKELYMRYQNNALSRVKNFDRKLIFGQFEQLYQKTLSYRKGQSVD